MLVQCNSCDLVFDDRSEGLVVASDTGEQAVVCPNCQSGDLDDFDEENDLLASEIEWGVTLRQFTGGLR